MTNFLYTLPECRACALAKEYLNNNNIEYEEIIVSDPMTELGIRTIFNGNLYAPVIALVNKGFYLFRDNQLIKIKVE